MVSVSSESVLPRAPSVPALGQCRESYVEYPTKAQSILEAAPQLLEFPAIDDATRQEETDHG